MKDTLKLYEQSSEYGLIAIKSRTYYPNQANR